MTIRTAILRGSLALVLGSILLSGVLSFYEFRQALQSEIAHTLQVTSTALLARIDSFLYDRLEDAREWRMLEIMQDIRVGDVDKRLARLLSDLKQGHGSVYQDLYCTDLNGRVVAATDPALVGTVHKAAGSELREIRAGSADVTMETFDPVGGPDRQGMILRTTVPDAFGKGDLGYLYVVLNWNEVERFLREAVSGTPRTAVLLNRAGHLIGSSRPLEPGSVLTGKDLTDRMTHTPADQPDTRKADAFGAGTMLVGVARSATGRRFSGFGWHLLIVEPTSVAFAPVWRLAWIILGVLILTMAVAGWVSLRLSARIAQPIAGLTDFARRLRGGDKLEPPRIESGVTEVRELSRAFAEMIEALARSREHLVRAGKLAVVGEMAAIMAHEVRTPLGILRSSAQLLERRPELTPEDRELTGYIKSETDRLSRLVTTLLETSTPRPPAFRPDDLHELLEHVLALVESKIGNKQITLERDLAATDSILNCDREQLIQVFLNLLINAIQFTPEGGRLGLSTEAAPGALIVYVDDSGPGVPPAERARVFDPFFTQRQGGIGLGLTVVQQIVQAHGGEITVAESPWGGARFTVRLPNEGAQA